MKVYDRRSPEGYEFLLSADDPCLDQFAAIDGTKVTDWTPLRLKLLTEDEGQSLEPSDSPWLAGHVHVFRADAMQKLEPLIAGEAQFLPLSCEAAELYALNVFRVIEDAVDLERSSIVRFSSGRIMNIDEYVFRPEALRGAGVFKIPELEPSPIYMTGEFVAAVQKLSLRGLEFELLWEE